MRSLPGDESGQPLRIATTSTGGGNARLAAVVAALVLLVVVSVAVGGKPQLQPGVASLPTTASDRATNSPPSSAMDSPTPSWAPSATPLPWLRTPNPDELRFSFEIGQDAFAVIAFIDGRMFLRVLDEDQPGHFHGLFRIPFPSHADGHSISFAQLWTRDHSRRSYVPLDEWDLPLYGLGPDREPVGAVVQDAAEPQPKRRGSPRATRQGYSIIVRAETRGEYGVITVEVQLGDESASTP